MDDQDFATILADLNGEPAATADAPAADATAIGAAVPGDADVPEDEGTGDGADDGSRGSGVEAEGEGEGEGEGDGDEGGQPQVAPVPVSDPSHPEHAVWQQAQQGQQAQQALQALNAIAAQQQAQQANQQFVAALEGLPDVEPERLPGVVGNLIARAVAPVRQEAARQAALVEQAAAEFTNLHLAIKDLFPAEQVALIENRARELGRYGSWQVAQTVVAEKRQANESAGAEVRQLKAKLAEMEKRVKALARDPNADRVGGSGPKGVAPTARTVESYEGDNAFDEFFDDLMQGRVA